MEYQIMLYGGMAGAVITLIISIILYIKMEIAQVIEDLTGVSLRRRLHSKKNARDDSNEKRMTKEIMLKKQYAGEAYAGQETELMSSGIEDTALLDGYIEETSLLTADLDETSVLADSDEETSLLIEEDYFKKEVDVIVVHTTTII